MPAREHVAIQDLANTYFEALYEGSTDKFAAVFHEDATLYSCGGGDYVHMGLDVYLDIVRNREAPAMSGKPRRDELLSINVTSPTLAILRTREVFFTKLFTDELVLMKFDGCWKIVAKAWDFEVLADEEEV